MISRPGPLVRIRRNDRLTIIRPMLDELADMPFLNLINVRVDKRGKPRTTIHLRRQGKPLFNDSKTR